jgi:hypothetical protein
MGYRSAVEAVFYTRNEEEWPILKLYIDENFPKFWADEGDEDTLKPIKATNVWGYHFIANNVKWYESYPEIQEFNEFAGKFLKLLAENERARPTWAYEFVRIGEEMNDIEEERSENAEFILCVSRDIQLLT